MGLAPCLNATCRSTARIYCIEYFDSPLCLGIVSRRSDDVSDISNARASSHTDQAPISNRKFLTVHHVSVSPNLSKRPDDVSDLSHARYNGCAHPHLGMDRTPISETIYMARAARPLGKPRISISGHGIHGLAGPLIRFCRMRLKPYGESRTGKSRGNNA